MKEKDHCINEIRFKSSKSHAEKEKVIKVIARDKVLILQGFLERFQGKINSEGMELILPYIEELFRCEDTSVQAAWSLFNLIGQEIGPIETSSRFLPHLTKLFSGENSTPKHMKMYHRTFLVQLVLRLGLRTFLSNFATLLVEAVAGYKDYIFEDLFLDAHESSEIREMNRTRADTIEQEDSNLPPLVEENQIEDQGGELLSQENEDFPESSVKEDPTESTQDDIDEIADEILDDVSCSNGDKVENDKDNESIGSFNQNEDELSNKSDRSEEGRSGRSEGEEAGRGGDQDSLQSFGGLIEMSRTRAESISDVEADSWPERADDSSKMEGLQFQVSHVVYWYM